MRATFTPSIPMLTAQRLDSPAYPLPGMLRSSIGLVADAPSFLRREPKLQVCSHALRETCTVMPLEGEIPALADAGEYSAERLQALRQNAKQLPARPARKAQSGGGGGGFKLSGSFKAAVKPVDDRFEVNASDLVRRAPRDHVHTLLPLIPVNCAKGQSLCLGSTVFSTARREANGAHVSPAAQGRGGGGGSWEVQPGGLSRLRSGTQMSQPATQPVKPPPAARGVRKHPTGAGSMTNGAAPQQPAAMEQPAVRAPTPPPPEPAAAAPGSDSDEDGAPAFSIPNQDAIRWAALSAAPP